MPSCCSSQLFINHLMATTPETRMKAHCSPACRDMATRSHQKRGRHAIRQETEVEKKNPLQAQLKSYSSSASGWSFTMLKYLSSYVFLLLAITCR